MAKLKGYRIKTDKDGKTKVVKAQRVLDASAAIRQRTSKKQRVVRKGTPT